MTAYPAHYSDADPLAVLTNAQQAHRTFARLNN